MTPIAGSSDARRRSSAEPVQQRIDRHRQYDETGNDDRGNDPAHLLTLLRLSARRMARGEVSDSSFVARKSSAASKLVPGTMLPPSRGAAAFGARDLIVMFAFLSPVTERRGRVPTLAQISRCSDSTLPGGDFESRRREIARHNITRGLQTLLVDTKFAFVCDDEKAPGLLPARTPITD